MGRLLADKLTRRPLDKEHFNYREEMVSPGATFTILPDVWRQTSNNTKPFVTPIYNSLLRINSYFNSGIV